MIPVFELERSVPYPETKRQLIKYASRGLARQFHLKIYRYGHWATNYSLYVHYIFFIFYPTFICFLCTLALQCVWSTPPFKILNLSYFKYCGIAIHFIFNLKKLFAYIHAEHADNKMLNGLILAIYFCYAKVF